MELYSVADGKYIFEICHFVSIQSSYETIVEDDTTHQNVVSFLSFDNFLEQIFDNRIPFLWFIILRKTFDFIGQDTHMERLNKLATF